MSLIGVNFSCSGKIYEIPTYKLVLSESISHSRKQFELVALRVISFHSLYASCYFDRHGFFRHWLYSFPLISWGTKFFSWFLAHKIKKPPKNWEFCRCIIHILLHQCLLLIATRRRTDIKMLLWLSVSVRKKFNISF